MSQGELFIVATPIGNLQDFSPRAAKVLGDVDLVLAEDTLHSQGLLTHHGLRPELQSLHEHNEAHAVPGLVQRMVNGERMAVISDAGTPLISDPGYRLVAAAHRAGIPVRTVPGPSAVIAVLSVSGLPTDRFSFEGFVPARDGARARFLGALASEPRTLVFFETGRRLLGSLAAMAEAFGEQRPLALCRELTKRFETVLYGPLAEVQARVRADPDQTKGEFVLVVGGHSAAEEEQDLVAAIELARTLTTELPPSKAAQLAARITGAPRRVLYDALTESGAD
ncbi:MAG: 16S rRNA (cytidine(1402)-2'-O)-methyltransferase [Pseudomonadota bacterium]